MKYQMNLCSELTRNYNHFSFIKYLDIGKLYFIFSTFSLRHIQGMAKYINKREKLT